MNIFTLDDAFCRLYRPQRLLGRSRDTVHQHEVALRHFRRFLQRAPLLGDLTDDTLAAFADWFSTEIPRSPVTVNKTLARIRAQWRFLARKRLVNSEPTGLRLIEPEQIPEAWSEEQLAALFDACRSQPGMIAGIPAGAWWHSLHLVLYDTGERIGAVRQLRWLDLDLGRQLVTVRAAVRKGRAKPMIYALHADTVAALREIHGPHELVWPWPYAHHYLWVRYRDVLQAAGLPADRRSKFHRMRRSTASHLEAAGVDSTRALGHTSRAITVSSYLDPRISRIDRPCDSLPRPA